MIRNETRRPFPAPEIPTWIRTGTIGKGSFATVSLAVSKLDGRLFAVKSVDNNPTSTTAHLQLDALENEISVLRSLSSPHIVAYRGEDLTAEGSTVFRNLHLEYLSGGSAATAAGIIDEGTVRQYTRCLVSALKYIHSKGIVHCDVKSSNVLLDGSVPGLAKLADFGSARWVGSWEKDHRKRPRGSPLWMAPEVIRREPQGPESDVWSLGCTVIEIITGKPAWEDEGADTLRRIGYSTESPRIPGRMSELGRDFVEKCLRREPSKRWGCNQLLQHPFVSYAAPETTRVSDEFITPRSVIVDWSDCSGDNDEEGGEAEGRFVDSLAAQRIEELAALCSGVSWESDSWVEVRVSGTRDPRKWGQTENLLI